jgi:hypothetical protein
MRVLHWRIPRIGIRVPRAYCPILLKVGSLQTLPRWEHVLLAGPAGANALVSIGMPTTSELLGVGPQVAVVLPINDRGDANTPGVERHRAVLGRRLCRSCPGTAQTIRHGRSLRLA